MGLLPWMDTGLLMSENENARAQQLLYVVVVPRKMNSQIIKLHVKVRYLRNQLIEGVNKHPVMIPYLGFLCCLFPGCP